MVVDFTSGESETGWIAVRLPCEVDVSSVPGALESIVVALVSDEPVGLPPRHEGRCPCFLRPSESGKGIWVSMQSCAASPGSVPGMVSPKSLWKAYLLPSGVTMTWWSLKSSGDRSKEDVPILPFIACRHGGPRSTESLRCQGRMSAGASCGVTLLI